MNDVLPQEREHWKKMFCGMMKKREVPKEKVFVNGVITEEAFGHVAHLGEHLDPEDEIIENEIEKELLEKADEADNKGATTGAEQ